MLTRGSGRTWRLRSRRSAPAPCPTRQLDLAAEFTRHPVLLACTPPAAPGDSAPPTGGAAPRSPPHRRRAVDPRPRTDTEPVERSSTRRYERPNQQAWTASRRPARSPWRGTPQARRLSALNGASSTGNPLRRVTMVGALLLGRRSQCSVSTGTGNRVGAAVLRQHPGCRAATLGSPHRRTFPPIMA
jgi:hypothetical protein